ncbi:hypothetical protein ACA758_03880 [Mycoplasmopsis agassizii]|uniref:hypothetical protein n=1 Tax=Mycoplasmopsis agassizii TaxID=33922 RepID=UPI00352985D0
MKIQKISSQILFAHNEANSHSYRIPSLLKLKNNNLIAIVDQRLDSQLDAPYSEINQVVKVSKDDQNFSPLKIIMSFEHNKNIKASFIDSSIIQDKFSRVHLLVDIFPSNGGLMPIVNKLNPLNNLDKVDQNGLPYLYDSNLNKYYLVLDYKKTNQYFIFDQQNIKVEKFKIKYYFDSSNSKFYFDLYELKNKKDEYLYSLFDATKNDRFHLTSGSYLAHFISDDFGNSFKLNSLLNYLFINKSNNINATVVSPGRAVSIEDEEKNEYLIFNVYETKNAMPHKVYELKYNTGINKWTVGTYLNENLCNQWLSETAIIKSKDKTLYAISRNPNYGKLLISKKKYHSNYWSDLDYLKCHQSQFDLKNINTQIMHGVTNFNYLNDEYILISLPSTHDRKEGNLFVFKNYDFKNILLHHKITREDESFGYSNIEILNIENNKIKFAILYEMSYSKKLGLEWLGEEGQDETDYKNPSEIIYDVFELIF